MTDQRTDDQVQDPIRAVVVDDSSEVRFLVSTMLEMDGRFAVIGEAHSAHDALTVVSDLDPDLVIVDLNLGRQNGAWLISELRKRRNDAVLAVVTGSLDDNDHDAALHAGADSVHNKISLTSTMVDEIAASVASRREPAV